jgi:hypothetical protein
MMSIKQDHLQSKKENTMGTWFVYPPITSLALSHDRGVETECKVSRSVAFLVDYGIIIPTNMLITAKSSVETWT